MAGYFQTWRLRVSGYPIELMPRYNKKIPESWTMLQRLASKSALFQLRQKSHLSLSNMRTVILRMQIIRKKFYEAFGNKNWAGSVLSHPNRRSLSGWLHFLRNQINP